MVDPYPFAGLSSDFAFGQAEYLAAASAEAKEAIAQARGVLESLGAKVSGDVVQAHAAWRGILDQARAVNADLIVMGSHGRRGMEKMILGSVTQAVLAHSHFPVLVIRD